MAFSILFLSITNKRVLCADVVVATVVDHQSLAVFKGQTLSFDAPSKTSKTTTIKSDTYNYSSSTDSSSSYDIIFSGLVQSGYSTSTTSQGSRSYGSSNVYVYINGHKYTYQYDSAYRVEGSVGNIYFESTCTADYLGGYDSVLKKYGKYIGIECLKSTDLTITINKVRSAQEQELIDEVKNGNELQEKGNELQQEGNSLQKEQNEISKSIFDKIADFFGSFFDNFIESFKGLFIPEDGFFTSYFSSMNKFFSDKLGMLYAPIDLFIKVVTGIKNAKAVSGASSLVFPELKWGDTVIIKKTAFNIRYMWNEAYGLSGIVEKVKFVNNCIMILAVINLLRNKLKEILEK